MSRKSKQHKQQHKQRNNKRKNRRSRAGLDRGLAAGANLIAHPCDAPLVSGLSGTTGGLVERVRNVNAQFSTEAAHGYILFAPAYVGTSATKFSILCYSDSSSASTPTTIGAFNQTDFSGGGTFHFYPPGRALSAADVMTDLRVTAGCLKVQYTGTNDAAQGVLGIIDNLPADIFDKVGVWPSVDQVMAMSTSSERIGLRDHEVVYREPDTEIAHELNDGCWEDLTSSTQPTETARTHGSRVIGIVWSGAAANCQLRFEFTQVVEGQPKRWVNVVPSPPRSTGPNPKPIIHRILDKVKPNWTKPTTLMPFNPGGLMPTAGNGGFIKNGVLRAGHGAAKGAGDAVSNGFGNFLEFVGKAAGGALVNKALGYAAEETLPLLLV